MGSIALTTGQGATASAAFSDAQGVAQVPAGLPVWTSSDPSVAEVAAAPDGLSAIVTAVAAGAATITCSTTNADGVVGSGTGDVSVSEPVVNHDIVKVDVEFVAK